MDRRSFFHWVLAGSAGVCVQTLAVAVPPLPVRTDVIQARGMALRYRYKEPWEYTPDDITPWTLEEVADA